MTKSLSRFPDPHGFGDIVAVGGDFNPALLLDAYSHGIFPWPMADLEEIPWFCPLRRALLIFDQIHIPRSLAKARRQSTLRFTIDEAFFAVIEGCRNTPRPGQEGTWITDEVVAGYTRLHELGRAHSVEAWQGDVLVGGVYGVDGGGTFAAESMFFREENASKLCLLHLIDHLKARGLGWMDIQVMTPHMERLGAREVDRSEYLELLGQTQKKKLQLFP